MSVSPPDFSGQNDTEQQTVLINSSSIKASLSLAEPVLFLYGFSKSEQRERPPALLRGSLILRISKPTKLKSVSLKFRGISRTEWPEGIPPKKIETFETKDIYSHVWPFFSAHLPAENGSGAHVVQPLENELSGMSALPRGRTERQVGGALSETRSRSMSNPMDPLNVFHRHTGSPSPGPRSGDMASKGYRQFQPAEYIYSFELAIPQMLAESIRCNFGQVKYLFELQIERAGTFKSNLTGSRDLTILRSLGMSNLESSEPIVISRDWEDQLHYEIVIAGKAFLIGGFIPVAFSFVPLAKVRCHRIRIYITEHTEYFCKNRKVHRVEPVHKFLLLEKVSRNGIHSSLLEESTDLSNLTAFEFSVQIPTTFKSRRDRLHPNANVGTIKVHHWIKVVLRLSRAQTDAVTGKTKYYEVSIDSPITLLDPRTVTANTLPEYQTRETVNSEHLRPYQEYVESQSALRPIHLMRKPSVAPPPFEAESEPPNIFPPQYDQLHESPDSYQRRYEEYHARVSSQSPSQEIPHFSDIIWRDDNSDDSVQAAGSPESPGAYPEALVSETVNSPLQTPSTEHSTSHTLTSPISKELTESGTEGFPFLLNPRDAQQSDEADPLDTAAAAPAHTTPALAVDTKLPRDTLEHPYMPLSPRSSLAGWPYHAGSGPSSSSLHSLTRPGSSARPGSALRDSRPRMGSATSLRSPRYYRQSSIISVDLVDQGGSTPTGRRPSRVANLSEVEDVTDWYHSSRNGSLSSLGVSVLEYERPDQNPLLPGGRAASTVSADLADFDYEDDVASIYSSTSNYIRPQPFFHT